MLTLRKFLGILKWKKNSNNLGFYWTNDCYIVLLIGKKSECSCHLSFFQFLGNSLSVKEKAFIYPWFRCLLLSDFWNILLFFFWSRKITTYVSLCSPLKWVFSHQFKSQYCISRLSRCASMFTCMNVSIIQMGHRRENRLRQQRKKQHILNSLPPRIIFSLCFFCGYWSEGKMTEADSFHKKSFFYIEFDKSFFFCS